MYLKNFTMTNAGDLCLYVKEKRGNLQVTLRIKKLRKLRRDEFTLHHQSSLLNFCTH